jgi:TonB family protein
MDFKDYKDGNAAMLKISLRKSEAAPNSATSNTFRIDELKKTGDVIFLGFNKKKNVVFVRSEKVVVFPKPKSDTTLKSKKIRKVADSVIRGETKSIIRGKIDSTINKKTNSIIKKEITGGTSFKLPWSSPGFNNLFIYLGKNIHYPAAEYDKRIVGNVVVEFTVSNEYKITDVKVMKDAHPAFANEVVRATKRYTDTINRPPGTYVLGVQFNLVTEKMTKTWLPKGLVNDIDDKPNYAGIIETVGYIKE